MISQTQCSQCGRNMMAFIPSGLHSEEFIKMVIRVCGNKECKEKADAAWKEEQRLRRRLGMSEALVVS
jgi:hypothetical protein